MTDDQHLSDIEIEMALDDQLPPLRQTHLFGCRLCIEQVDRAAQAGQALKTRLYRRTCPSSERLAQFEYRELNNAAASTIEAHVARCPHCQNELAVLRAYMNDRHDMPRPEAPRPARPPLTQQLRAHRAPQEVLRGGQKMPTLSFDVPGMHVFLEFADHGPEMVLSGQIVAQTQSNWEDALIHVSHNNRLIGMATTNEMGEFRVSLARSTPITLRMTNNEGESIVVDDIDPGLE
jgi:hypothetical protein